VLQFVPLEDVDPIYFSRSYYLEPEGTGTKPYVLLREALESSGKIAVVKVALRQRESLACLRVREGVLVLEMMLWPDEIRAPDFAFLDDDLSVRSQEVQMAQSLIDAMSGDFDPGQYTDQYREALESLIEAKVAGRDVVEPEPSEEQPGEVVDLMAALRASVEAAKKGRGEPSEAGPRATKKAASQKGEQTGKKAASKPAKRPAKKAAQKKAARKSA
jgi:DNA end-binding protein Ku